MSQPPAGDIVVIDTNVVSYAFKRDTRALLYRPHLEGRLGVIAAQTLAELEATPLLNNWGTRRHEALRAYLKKFVFAEADEAVCLRSAQVQAGAKKAGRPISVGDAWIAATALAFAAPLVTHDPNDFKHVPGLIVITEK